MGTENKEKFNPEVAKETMKEELLVEHLQKEGFSEIKESDKRAPWYKKAAEIASCLHRLR